MSKKISKNGRVKPDKSLRLAIGIVASFLVFLAAFVYIQFKAHTQSYCANSISCVNDLSGKRETTNNGIFMGRKVTAPTQSAKPVLSLSTIEDVLGGSATDSKHIFVDLSGQKLYAYDGNKKIFAFDISSGKWGPTPTGTFRIHTWLRYTRMTGGDEADGTFYDLPNVPYTMYFGNDEIPWYRGFSLHGAYWHNNFGHPMSHGCVNMRIDDAAKIYYWTNPKAGDASYETKDHPGTLITIYGSPPDE